MKHEDDRYRRAEREFAEFLAAEPAPPPRETLAALTRVVHAGLHPAPLEVFGKLVLIVLASGAVTLLLCPQFGLGFMRSSGLFELFMSLGHYICRIACGALFLGAGALACVMLLSPEELRVVRRHPVLQFSAASLICLAAFVALGAQVFVGATLLWFAGSVAAAAFFLEAGYRLKTALLYA